MAGMTDFSLTGLQNAKSACAGGVLRPDRKQSPNRGMDNIGILNVFMLHLPFCPKATFSIGI
jgi:hypothetical protein